MPKVSKVGQELEALGAEIVSGDQSLQPSKALASVTLSSESVSQPQVHYFWELRASGGAGTRFLRPSASPEGVTRNLHTLVGADPEAAETQSWLLLF